MCEEKSLYQELQKKKKEIEKRLADCEAQLASCENPRRSIVIKKIKGKLYYYVQWRQEGHLKSRFLATVEPGVIAQEERDLLAIQKLRQEEAQLKDDIENLSRILSRMGKQRLKKDLLDSFTFEVYWKDEITARVYVRKKEIVVSRFTDDPGRQLFAETHMSRHQLGEIFELRCWDRHRPDIDAILAHLDLSEYNPYEIVRKTHGVSYNDYIWFRFSGEQITSRDVLVR